MIARGTVGRCHRSRTGPWIYFRIATQPGGTYADGSEEGRIVECEKEFREWVPVKVMIRNDLKSNDARRAASDPHSKVSLDYVDQILGHLAKHKISMYRLSSDVTPYSTHPDMPHFHGMTA